MISVKICWADWSQNAETAVTIADGDGRRVGDEVLLGDLDHGRGLRHRRQM